MKRSYVVVALLAIAFIFAGAYWQPSKYSENTNLKANISSIPAEIQTILEKSCFACHGEGGKGMALSRVNFSNWADYSPEKKAQKAEAICKVVTNGSMPPRGYVKTNPDAALDQAQIESICSWSKTVNVNK
jgi:cytochrome c5